MGVAPLVTKKVQEYEQQFVEAVAKEDDTALQLWKTNRSGAVEFLTASAEKRGNDLIKDWLSFYQKLFIDFRDGSSPKGAQSGYTQDWYDRIAKETGDKYKIPEEHDTLLNAQKLCVISKSRSSECASASSSLL